MRAFTGLITAGLLYACSPPAPPTLPANTEQVADGVYLFQSGDHRSLFLVGSEVTRALGTGADDYLAGRVQRERR